MIGVLVVEDEDDIRMLSRVVLQQAGFEVHEVSSGAAALEALAPGGSASTVRVVMLDLRMGDLDGFTVLERLRAAGCLPGLAVIVVSAHADPGVVARAKDVGAWGYLRKPFDPHELVELVHAAAGALA